MNDLVSVIIPSYKGCRKLNRAIDSVTSQTYQNVEIIVVDDNYPDSEDRKKTEDIMSIYRSENIFYYKHNENLNGAVARNTGIQAARGKYIAFLDDDDYYLPMRIEQCVDFLHKNSRYAGVIAGVKMVDEHDHIINMIEPQKDLCVCDLLLNEMVIGTGSNIFLTRDAILGVNGFDEEFKRRQDIEFMIRICGRFQIGYIPEILMIKSTNGTFNHPDFNKMYDIIEKFNKKFSNEIEELGEKKAQYLGVQYQSLFSIALYERDKSHIQKAEQLIRKYRKLTFAEKVISFIYKNGLRDTKLVNYLMMLRKNRTN